jgi:hypothetical protein
MGARPFTLVRAVTAVPGGSTRASEYGACGTMKCAGIDEAIPGTLTEAEGAGFE